MIDTTITRNQNRGGAIKLRGRLRILIYRLVDNFLLLLMIAFSCRIIHKVFFNCPLYSHYLKYFWRKSSPFFIHLCQPSSHYYILYLTGNQSLIFLTLLVYCVSSLPVGCIPIETIPLNFFVIS
jgi:hypothetical protein